MSRRHVSCIESFCTQRGDPEMHNGESDWISLEDLDTFVANNPGGFDGVKFKTSNGSTWSRGDSSPLALAYILEKKHVGGRLVEIKLNGFKEGVGRQLISKEVRAAVLKRDKVCPVSGQSSGLEFDHRCPVHAEQAGELTIADVQLLSRGMNQVKREHCLKCVRADVRFDATMLGHPMRWLEGGEKRTEHGCVGCYWYDVRGFLKELGKNWEPVKDTGSSGR